MTDRAQLSLFGGAAPSAIGPQAVVTAEQRRIAERLPQNLYFGTSSWTFPGWAGIVFAGYPSKALLVDRGLEAYARHPLLRAAGVDRSYWAPVPVEEWRRYASQTPPEFRTVAKAFSELTTAVFADHARLGERAGQTNPRFLDPELAMSDVVRPYLEGMAERAGPLVLEIAPIPERFLADERGLHLRMQKLFEALPRDLSVSVELRTPRLLTPRYLGLLAEHRVGHVLNYWSGMPTPAQQAALGADRLPGDLVFRLLQPPGSSYEALLKAYEPFDAIKAPAPALRADAIAIGKRALAEGRRVFVIVGNKAEGCAPLTVYSMAEEWCAE